MNAAQRKSQRTELRAARRRIDAATRDSAARRVAEHVDHFFHLKAGQRIALYSSLPDELDVGPLAKFARARGCRLYLPRIERRTGHIHFILAEGAMRANHLGIAEPAGRNSIGARWLDLVFLPLVGFDSCGMRLGMGGGYYDRTFAYLNLRTAWRSPLLIGIGYAMQHIEPFEAAPHDVRLDAVITEEGLAYKHNS